MYTPKASDVKKVINNFTYHAPHGIQADRYGNLREKAKTFAEYLLEECPPSRELTLALTNLEQATFWANASIARNEPVPLWAEGDAGDVTGVVPVKGELIDL